MAQDLSWKVSINPRLVFLASSYFWLLELNDDGVLGLWVQGPSKNWEKLLLSLGATRSEPGIEGEEIAPLAKENVATP